MRSLFGSSGIEVVTATPEQVVLVAHHDRIAALIFVLALSIAVFLFFRARSHGTSSAFAVIFLVAGIAFGSGAIEHAKASLDRASNRVTVQRTTSFLRQRNSDFALTELDHAEVRSNGTTMQFCLVLQNGGCIALKGYVNDDGQYEAAAAVNQFLGVHR